jgi:uncharacterized protein (TIGR03435 family)
MLRSGSQMNRNPRKKGLWVAAFCWAILAFGLCARGGDQKKQKLEFEVASVKPTALNPDRLHEYSRSGNLRLGARITGKRAEFVYMSLRRLVAAAYAVEAFRVAGPDWLFTDRFDVVGIMPEGSRKEDVPVMLQALLAERFRLAVHRESRLETVTALVVAEGGPRLKESPSEEQKSTKGASLDPSTRFFAAGTAEFHLSASADNQSVHVRASKMTMADLAHLLTQTDLGDHPVVDMTGLTGNYDIALDVPVSPSDQAGISDSGQQGSSPALVAPDPGTGGILRTLKSLGLELKKTKASLDYIVVDHIDKQPSQN